MVELDFCGIWYGIGFYKVEIGSFIKLVKCVVLWSLVISNELICLVEKDEWIVVIILVMFVGFKLEKFVKVFLECFFDVGIVE